MTLDPVSFMKESWQSNEKAFFEYHCEESHTSADAELWYRSHQEVTILKEEESDAWEGSTLQERSDEGHPKVYKVVFIDGFEAAATEDELFISTKGFYCDPPPKRPRNMPSYASY